jgi:hypothetical protein
MAQTRDSGEVHHAGTSPIPEPGETSSITEPAATSEIKLIELVHKRPDISDERFHYHWKVVHGPLGQAMVHLIRYIQLHRVGPCLPGLPIVACEGIVEGWFSSLETLQATFVDPAYIDGTRPDEELFLDQARLTAILAREETLEAGAPDRPAGAKAVLLLKRRPDLDIDEFQTLWRVFGEELTAAASPWHAVRSVPLDTEYDVGEPAYDGFDFLAWPDLMTTERAWDSGPVRDLLPRLADFADLTRSAGFLAEEYRVTWP